MSNDNNDIQVSIGLDASPIEQAFQDIDDKADSLTQSLQSKFSGVGLGDKISEQLDSASKSIEDFEGVLASALNSTVGQDFAINLDASIAMEQITALDDAMAAAVNAGYIATIGIDTSQAESELSGFEGIVGNLPPINIPVTADPAGLDGINGALKETTAASDSAHESVATPFVITAGDVISQAQELSGAFERISEAHAKVNESAARIGLLNNSAISEDDIKAMSLAYQNEDHTMQDVLAIEKKLALQKVDTKEKMEALIPVYQNWGEAMGTTGADAMAKTTPMFKAFGVSLQDQQKYMEGVVRISEETSLGLDGLGTATQRVGYNFAEAGMSINDFEGFLLAAKSKGLGDRQMYALFNQGLKEITDSAEKAGTDVPKGTDAVKALADTLGWSVEDVNKFISAQSKATGEIEKFGEAEKKGHTAWQGIETAIQKATYGVQDFVTPLEPAAAGILGVAAAGAQLAIFDKFLLDGKIASGIKGIGAASTGVVGEVGLLEGALASLGGGPVIAGLAAVTLGIAAWETDFMGVRTKVLDAAQTIFDGFSTTVERGLSVAQDGGNAISNAIIGAFSGKGFDGTGLLSSLDTIVENATSKSGSGGAEAAQAFISKWNEAIAAGELSAPNIPDSSTAIRNRKGTDTKIDATAPVVINGTTLHNPGDKLINGTWYSSGSGVDSVGLSAFNKAFGSLPAAGGVQQSSTDVTTPAVVAAASALSAELIKRGYSSELANDPDSAKALGKSLGIDADALKASTAVVDASKLQATETTKATKSNSTALDGVTTAAKSTTAALNDVSKSASQKAIDATTADTSASSKSGVGASVAIDPFTVDPAQYLKDKLTEAAKTAGYETVSGYESYLNEYGKTIKDKAKELFSDEKSEGFGGKWDFDAWFSEASKGIPHATEAVSTLSSVLSSLGLDAQRAAAVQQNLNGAIADNTITNTEVKSVWDSLNQAIGQSGPLTQAAATQTLDLTQAYGRIQAAQETYAQYMQDGSLSTKEASDMNKRLADINALLGQSGVTATGGISGLPPALQSLASFAQSAVNQINAAIAGANQAVASANAAISAAQAKMQSAGSTIGTAGFTAVNGGKTTINQTVDLSGSKFTNVSGLTSAVQAAFAGIQAAAR